MAKVVGKDKNAVLRKTCQSCASVVEYGLHEVKERHGTDYGGGPDGAKWIDCPNCGKKIILKSW